MSSARSAKRHALLACASYHKLGKLTPWEYQEQDSARCYLQVLVTLLSVTFVVGKKIN